MPSLLVGKKNTVWHFESFNESEIHNVGGTYILGTNHVPVNCVPGKYKTKLVHRKMIFFSNWLFAFLKANKMYNWLSFVK